jgi:hypothetical protein
VVLDSELNEEGNEKADQAGNERPGNGWFVVATITQVLTRTKTATARLEACGTNL